MNEQQTALNPRRVVWLALAAILLAVLLALGLMLTGRALAQDEPQATSEPVVRELVERVMSGNGGVVITSESGIGTGFPFEDALRKMVVEGTLTQNDADSIMNDLSSLTNAVQYSSNLSPDGQMREIIVDVDIRSDDDTLRPAMEQALDNAVANGLLTAEQAAQVLADVDAAPDSAAIVPGEIIAFSTTGALDAAGLLDGPLGDRLDSAVTAGTISQTEAQTFRDILAKLLAPAE